MVIVMGPDVVLCEESLLLSVFCVGPALKDKIGHSSIVGTEQCHLSPALPLHAPQSSTLPMHASCHLGCPRMFPPSSAPPPHAHSVFCTTQSCSSVIRTAHACPPVIWNASAFLRASHTFALSLHAQSSSSALRCAAPSPYLPSQPRPAPPREYHCLCTSATWTPEEATSSARLEVTATDMNCVYLSRARDVCFKLAKLVAHSGCGA